MSLHERVGHYDPDCLARLPLGCVCRRSPGFMRGWDIMARTVWPACCKRQALCVQEDSRLRRIAKGSGCPFEVLQQLLMQHKQLSKTMQGERQCQTLYAGWHYHACRVSVGGVYDRECGLRRRAQFSSPAMGGFAHVQMLTPTRKRSAPMSSLKHVEIGGTGASKMKGMPKAGKGGKGAPQMNMDPSALSKMLPPGVLQQVPCSTVSFQIVCAVFPASSVPWAPGV